MLSGLESVYRDRRVQVTGHTGFKGGWLSLWLNSLGTEITGAALTPPTRSSLFEAIQLEGRLDHRKVDIRDAAALEAVVKEAMPEIVFDLAAQPIERRSYQEPIETPRHQYHGHRTSARSRAHCENASDHSRPSRGLALRHGGVSQACGHAHGPRYKGRPVGGPSHIAAFSFCQDKIITTGGEGGMLVTSNLSLWEKAWTLKDHGKSFETVYHREHKPGFRWRHESIGTNWRMTEMQAAIGRIQLGRLEGWHRQRRENVERLAAAVAGIPAYRSRLAPADIDHAFYRSYLFVEPKNLAPGWDRNRVMNAISERGVPCFSGSCSEIYKEKAFSSLGLNDVHLPIAARLGETSIAFLVYPTLDEDEIKHCCQVPARLAPTRARRTYRGRVRSNDDVGEGKDRG